MPHVPDTSIPAILSRCIETYKALYDRSTIVEADDGEMHVIFTGSITEVFFSVPGVNSGNYGSISKKLQEMGCMEFINKGTGHIPSSVRLHFAPQSQLYALTKKKNVRSKEAALLQRLAAAEKRIISLEIRVNKLDGRTAAPIDLGDD